MSRPLTRVSYDIPSPEVPQSLAKFSSEILAALRPCVKINALDTVGDPRPWISRIGGPVDLVPGTKLPRFEGKCIPFFAQVNCKDLPALPTALHGDPQVIDTLPNSGVIQFFADWLLGHDTLNSHECFQPKAAWQHVRYIAEPPSQIERELAPCKDGAPLFTETNGAAPLTFSIEWSGPGRWEDFRFETGQPLLTAIYGDPAYMEYENLFFKRQMSNLAGFATTCQNDPRFKDSAYEDLECLLNLGWIDADGPGGHLNLEWVSGMGSWWIRRADLAALNFADTFFYWDSM
jgi:uncharacterized protein YwqG